MAMDAAKNACRNRTVRCERLVAQPVESSGGCACGPSAEHRLDRDVLRSLRTTSGAARENLAWLHANMAPIFFHTMREEPEAVAALCLHLRDLSRNRHLVLADREKEMMLARLSVPGSLYETLRFLDPREISYGEIAHSYSTRPGDGQGARVPAVRVRPESGVGDLRAGRPRHPGPDPARHLHLPAELLPPVPSSAREELLRILWRNNPGYVRLSPPERVARILWLLHQAKSRMGIHIDVQEADDGGARGSPGEPRPLRRREPAAEGLPAPGDGGVQPARTSASGAPTRLTISTGILPLLPRDVLRDPPRRGAPRRRIPRSSAGCAANSTTPRSWPPARRRTASSSSTRLMTGEEASLVNAFIGFCHTNLAHNQPDRFTLEDVSRAFHSHPDIALQLVRLFELRFDPEIAGPGAARTKRRSRRPTQEIEEYNTGHRQLDEFRRAIFRSALSFIRRTLKTNFFVPEKQALAFRLDPAYLAELGPDFTVGPARRTRPSGSPSSSAASASATTSASPTSPAAAGGPSSPAPATTTSPVATPCSARTTSWPTPST